VKKAHRTEEKTGTMTKIEKTKRETKKPVSFSIEIGFRSSTPGLFLRSVTA